VDHLVVTAAGIRDAHLIMEVVASAVVQGAVSVVQEDTTGAVRDDGRPVMRS
jgi:hypothetical protein